MITAPSIPYEMKTSIIKVSAYEGKNIKGIFINPYFQQEMFFESTTQLLFLMEEVQDGLNYRQETMEKRSFLERSKTNERTLKEDVKEVQKVTLATFKIKVLFRQHASMQGSIIWVEKEMESQFRSALELIVLMDSVLK